MDATEQASFATSLAEAIRDSGGVDLTDAHELAFRTLDVAVTVRTSQGAGIAGAVVNFYGSTGSWVGNRTTDASGSLMPRMALAVKQRLYLYLSACQLGITLASLGLGAVTEPAVAAIVRPLLSQSMVASCLACTIWFCSGRMVMQELTRIVSVAPAI